jgi:hypothetical protein
MTADKQHQIADAEPVASRRERRPNLSPAELVLISAAKRYAQLDDRLREYPGARSGAIYEELLSDWRAAQRALVETARTIPGEPQ